MTIQSHFSRHALAPCLSLLLSLGLACGEAEPEASDEQASELFAMAQAPASDAALCCGTRTTLVEGIAGAENLFVTSDQRVLVTGDEGLYELLRENGDAFRAERLAPAEGCKFGGITETRDTLYVNCYASPDSFLYAAKLARPTSFQRVTTLAGIGLANGLSSDQAGHLYVACTAQDQILRLTVAASNSLKIEKQEVWLSGSGLFTNGMKVYDGALYWTDFTSVKTARILSNGRPGWVRTVATRLTFFDDLYVDERGILVADWLGNALRSFSPLGIQTGATSVALAMPSAVLRAKGRAGFSERALLLTEKGANRVALFEPR